MSYGLKPRYANKLALKHPITFKLPSNWCSVLVVTKEKSKVIYAYEQSYFFKIPTTRSDYSIRFDGVTNTYTIYSAHIWPSLKALLDKINNNTLLVIKPIFSKLKFIGKGYYLFKNKRNTLAPRFGYSHRIYIYWKTLHVTILSKKSLLCINRNFRLFFLNLSQFISIKQLNIFTLRGIRLTKQIVYKKNNQKA